MQIVCFCHLYYLDQWDEIRGYLNSLQFHEMYFNLVHDKSDLFDHIILKDFPSAKVIKSPNQGKDCGGNLRLI
jgi:lipopolysaccharide biosynthesis protein